MRILIFIDKTQALLAGKDVCGYKVVDVPAAELTVEQRGFLSKFTHVHQCYSGDFDLSALTTRSEEREKYSHIVINPTKETVIALIEAALEQERIHKQQELEKRQKQLAELIEKPDEYFVYSTKMYSPVEHWVWKVRGFSEFPELDSRIKVLQDKYEKINEDNLKATYAEKAAEESALAAEKAQKESDIQAFKDWARQCGSELLQKRIAGDFSWRSRAQEEFAQSFFAKPTVLLRRWSMLPTTTTTTTKKKNCCVRPWNRCGLSTACRKFWMNRSGTVSRKARRNSF